jgi:predicted kinase
MTNLEKIDSNRKVVDNERMICLLPCLIVLSGRPLSGKSYITHELVKRYNLEIIDVDEIRNEIDKERKKDGQIRLLDKENESKIMVQSYIEMCRRAKVKIESGRSVLINGTFSREEFKKPLCGLANDLKEVNVPFKIFLLKTDDDKIVEERIVKRKNEDSLSNIDSIEKYLWAKSFFEPISFVPVIQVDTVLDNCVGIIIDKLADLEVNENDEIK